MATKQKKNVSYNSIQSINEDWTLDERNNKPYSGESIQEFIKRTFNSKAGDFYYDVDATKYLIFASKENREKYLSDRETYADLLLGNFDAPANYEAHITLTSQANVVILKGTTGNYINFTFDIVNRSGISTGESVVVNFNFNNGGNVKRVTQVYNAGDVVHFLADDYLSTGVNNVTVVVTGRNTLASTMIGITYSVVELALSSDFAFTTPVEEGNYLSILYTLEGSGVKYLQWYIDGVASGNPEDITDLKVTRIKNIDISSLSVGKHNVQSRAYVTINGVNFYSKTLYFDFVVCPQNEQWDISGNHLTYVLLGLILNSPVSTNISINVNQYEPIAYKIGMYDWRNRNLTLSIKDNNKLVQTVLIEDDNILDKEYTPLTSGNHVLNFVIDENSAIFTVIAAEQDLGIKEETQGLLLKLSAKDRSNNEVNPASWTYEDISTVFNGITWNKQSGWVNGALVIPAGSNVEITINPLGNNPVNKGRTIEIDYEVADVENDNAQVVNLVDTTTHAGIDITATSAKLQSSGGTQINTKYRDGDRVHLAFIINRTSGDDARMMYIVNNGILERAANFAATDNFNVGSSLVIGSNACTVKVHSIRIYDKALTIEQAFGNYVIDQDNFVELARANDILNASTGRIDADKVNARIPIMIITGDMEPIFAATDKNTTVYVDVEYSNLQDPEKSFTAEHIRLRPQGTSSLGYPRKNLRLYTSESYGCTMKDANGKVIPDGKYSFKDKAQPVNCWTLKADYAESSGSHNTGIARLWNKLMYDAQVGNTFPLRTNAQVAALSNNYEYDVRTTIDGFPIVVFYRPTTESELICLGQYNFNNDKSTESVFGFVDIPGFDDSNVQCFEVLANEDPIALFDDVSLFDSNWSKAFESRYPDTKTPNLVPLKTLCTWINSCKSNQTKWNNEKISHFDIPKLAAYYVYLMRFGAVDQTVKNSMLTTEDGVHWFFINYDNDTVLGIDNISTVLNAWDYDRTTTKVGGGYIYAGHASVLWNCFEADPECMSMVRTIDNALYSAGLTYANLLKTFDEEQCDKWCERIYNDNGVYKYIKPFKEKGSEVLYMLQGNRKSYRHWWIKNRMEMYDAIWATGAYTNRVVRFIAEGAPANSQFVITAAKLSYFGYGINAVVQESGISVAKDYSHIFTIGQALAIGDPVNIYNAANISKVDLSPVTTYLTTLYLEFALDENNESHLKSLILGDGTTVNNKFTAIGGLATATALEELDIQGFTVITNIDFTPLKNLHKLRAVGSGLTSFVPAEGSTLSNVELPSTLQTIILNNVSLATLSIADYNVIATSVLRTVSFRNVRGTFDVKLFITNWLENYTNEQLTDFNVTITGINWTNVSADTLIHWGHIGTKNFQGSVTLSSMSYSQYNELVELYGDSAFTDYGTFKIIAPAGLYITGPTELNYGENGQYTATVFPNNGQELEYLLYNDDTLISPQTDSQNRVYRKYGGVTLYEATGVITVDSDITADITLKVRVKIKNTEIYSSYITLTAKHATYPAAVTISGIDRISANGIYNFTKGFSTSSFNAVIQSVTWSLTSNNACSITSSNDDTATITVTNTPSSLLNVVLTCEVLFTTGVTRTATKEISIQLTYPSSITITGDSTLNTNDTFDYTKAFDTNNFTADVLSVVWSLTSDEKVVISESNNNIAKLTIANGNDTAKQLTLTCTVTLTGDVIVTGNKTISISVIEAPAIEEWVDLGLPSGLLWCTHNLGATNPEDIGLYFAWGETTGYVNAEDRNTKLGRIDGFSLDSYNLSDASQIGTFINLPKDKDAANVYMGYDWRMPTPDDIGELVNNTNTELIANVGIKFTSKKNNNYIIIPYSGYYNGNNKMTGGGSCKLWSNYSYTNNEAYAIDDANLNSTYSRYYGLNIRPVRQPPVAVDLGLPSGTLWADRNIGALSPEDAGLYFAWGETEGYKDAADRNTKLTAKTGTSYSGGFNQAVYIRPGGASGIKGNLSISNDAATVMLGGSWRIPSKEETKELYDNTDKEWTTINGMSGWKFMKKSDNSVFIFFPAAGFYDAASLKYSGSKGYYWSSAYYDSSGAYFLFFTSDYINPNNDNSRFYGYSVHAVQ